MKRIAILASGTATGGGSGFEKLVEASRCGVLNAEVLCVLSNYESGGVRERADRLGIRFEHFASPWTPERFHNLVGGDVDLVCMSGWLKPLVGLNPTKTINIHPGPLPGFGGKGMYGKHVHEAVIDAYHQGKIKSSAVTMHFVTDNYDEGPAFLRHRVPLRPTDTPESVGARVNAAEHEVQALYTQYVLDGRIRWDGVNLDSLVIDL